MKVLTVTHSWPNSNNNTKGNFVEDETALLSDETQQEVLFLQSLDPKGPRSGRPYESTKDISVNSKKYLSLPKRFYPKLSSKSIARRISSSASQFQPDLIHIHFLYPGGVSVPYLPDKLKQKSVITIHGNEWFTLKEHTVFNYYLDALNQCSAIICVSEELKADVLDYYPHLEQKVTAISHGINTDTFHVTSFKNRPKDFISVGGISPVKAHDLTLKAIARTPKLRDHTLTIIGNLVDKKYQQDLLTFIDEENLTNVTFLPTVHRSKMPELYNQYSTFVLPSRYEGFGISFIEAAACGCSLIGPNSGGPASIICEEIGDKVSKDDVDGLSAALIKHLETDYNREKIHKNITNRFSLNAKKEKQLIVYKKVISQNKSH